MVEYQNHVVLQQFKNWMLPIAMIVGGVFHSFFASLAFLTPYLIFLMLLVPYCKLSLGELRIAPLHVRLLLVQIAGGLVSTSRSPRSTRCWLRALSSACWPRPPRRRPW